MAKPYLELCRRLGAKLRADAVAAGIFDHPDGKGDERENLAKGFLRPRLGTIFDIAKGEVIDSDGRSTPELDAVIYDGSVGACVHEGSTRQVIRIESVALTLEVKSMLTKTNADETSAKLHNRLLQLQRYYIGTDQLSLAQTASDIAQRLGQPAQDFEAPLRQGVSALVSHMDIPAVTNVVFAFDGPVDPETAASYMQTSFISAIFVLGRYMVVKKGFGRTSLNQELLLWATGEDAVAGLFDVVEHALHLHKGSAAWVTPDTMRYSRERERVLVPATEPK